MRTYLVIISAFLVSCAIEDPSIAEFDLQKIRLSGNPPDTAYFAAPEAYTGASMQANLHYAMSNGDTVKVSVCEYKTATLAKAFYYNHDRKFLRNGRRLFTFSSTLPIPENSATWDSLVLLTKRFPAGVYETSKCFSLKNSRADEDFSVQIGYFLGVEAPFIMYVRRYRDGNFTWSCACSTDVVSEEYWEAFQKEWQENFYGPDSTALMARLESGIVAAVYGDLDKKRMQKIFKEFTEHVR